MSSDDVVEAIKKQQTLNNNFREYIDKKPILFWVGVIDDDTVKQKVKRAEREIKDLTCFYNFHNDENYDLKTSIFSDEITIHLDVRSEIINLPSQDYGFTENKIPDRTMNLTRMQTKKDNIDRLYRLHMRPVQNTQNLHVIQNVRITNNMQMPEYCTESIIIF